MIFLIKITNIDNFLLYFYKNDTIIPLHVKCFLFNEIKERNTNLHKKLNIKNETQQEIFNCLQSKLKKLNLKDILDNNYINYNSFNLIFLHKTFDFSIEDISKELKDYMFQN